MKFWALVFRKWLEHFPQSLVCSVTYHDTLASSIGPHNTLLCVLILQIMVFWNFLPFNITQKPSWQLAIVIYNQAQKRLQTRVGQHCIYDMWLLYELFNTISTILLGKLKHNHIVFNMSACFHWELNYKHNFFTNKSAIYCMNYKAQKLDNTSKCNNCC